MAPNANLRQSDLVAILVLGIVLVMIAVASPTLPPTLQQDNLQYLKIARDLAAYRDVPGIYAQRIVPCAIVWAAKVLGLCDVITGFRVLSTVAITTFFFGTYFCYRRLELVPAVAASATVFVLIGSWPIVYGLSNVYQACDALAYPLALAFIMSVRARRYWPAVLVGAVGLGCRQQLLVLAVLGDLAAWSETRQMRWLAASGAHLAIFALLVGTAGQQGVVGLIGHVAVSWSTGETALRGLAESRLVMLFSPYLLVAMISPRATFAFVRRYWWVCGFAVVTAIQPLVAFTFTGPQNAARLMMIGLWPALFLGGLMVGRDVQSTRWALPFVLCPLLYGTDHLVSFTMGWPSPLGHRLMANVVVALVAYAAMRSNRRFTAMPSAGLPGPRVELL